MSYKWHHNFPKIAREAGFTIRELSIGHCIDWRFIASIDPYGIVNEQDYEKLDEFIPHISEVPIGNVLNNRILDPAIGKYFVLAQFSIQYLLFCKQFLDETVVEIRNSIHHLQEENVRLEKTNKKRNEEISALQKKFQRAETSNLQHSRPETSVVYPCSKCTKNFISPELLNAHMTRKHVYNNRPLEAAFERKASSTDTTLINTIKLELEVKQLKERLNAAERDLHNQRSRHHRCRICSEDNSSTIDAPKAKIVHSVGIQNNLTDDKDFNDKEAQTQTEGAAKVDLQPMIHPMIPFSSESMSGETQHTSDTISKSDLQSFLHEQKRLFESWKKEERQKFDQEIESVKQNLDDVIQSMEKSERNTPVPVSDENIWKDRYQALENMYEISQKQARETIESFEKAYTQKMEHLERMLLEVREAERKESLPTSNIVTVPQHSYNTSAHLRTVTLPTVVIQADPSATCANSSDRVSDELTKTVSNESEFTESDEELRSLEAAKTMGAAKTSIEATVTTKNVIKETSQTHPKRILLSPKKQILNQFRARLKAIGVDPKSNVLFGDTLDVASKVLADRREAQKKKYKQFYITRNLLLSTVDQLARKKVGETPQLNHKASKTPGEQPVVMSNSKNVLASKSSSGGIRLKTSPTFQLLPSLQKLQLPDMPSTANVADLNIFKSKTPSISSAITTCRPTIKLSDDDIITVHADITHSTGPESVPTVHQSVPTMRGSVSGFDEQVERLLHTPIKTVNQGTVPSDTIDLLDATMPTIPKPIPKKRVLFNLNETNRNNATGSSAATRQLIATDEIQHLQHKTTVQRSNTDEESDWNISSFEEEKY